MGLPWNSHSRHHHTRIHSTCHWTESPGTAFQDNWDAHSSTLPRCAAHWQRYISPFNQIPPRVSLIVMRDVVSLFVHDLRESSIPVILKLLGHSVRVRHRIQQPSNIGELGGAIGIVCIVRDGGYPPTAIISEPLGLVVHIRYCAWPSSVIVTS